MADSTELTQRTERFDLKALYETSRLLSASLDLEFVLNNLLLTAMSKLLVTRGAVLLYDPVLSAYKVASSKGIRELEPGQLIKIGHLGRDGMLRDDLVPAALAPYRVALVLPVRFGHREIGLIVLGTKATRQAFEQRELEFIQSLVNMSSAAVHNSLMVEELKQANRDLDGKIQQLNTLFDLSQEFNATIDRKQLIKLLSFALMGQLLVGRYLFMMRSTVGHEAAPEGQKSHFRIVTSKGIPETGIQQELISKLCGLQEIVNLQAPDAELASWEELADIGISLVIPLQQHGETCAVLCLGPKMTGVSYQIDEIEFLFALGNLAFVSLQNSYLVEEQIEKERLEEEMRLARDIQVKLLPQVIPTFPGVDIATLALPSRQVGGDYFDVARLENDRLLLAIADVTGKGVPAALLMANLQACLHVLFPLPMTIEEAALHINRVICENTSYDKFITYFHGIYHRETCEFQYVNAGHNPPMLLKKDGRLELLETGGLLFGVMKSITYERGTVRIEPGDLLVMFTDGVTEAMSPTEEEFGEDRLIKILQNHRHENSNQILNAVYNTIRQFSGDTSLLSDDLTLIVMKIEE